MVQAKSPFPLDYELAQRVGKNTGSMMAHPQIGVFEMASAGYYKGDLLDSRTESVPYFLTG